MTTPLGRLVDINPPVRDFDKDPDAEITFLPLECVWPDGRADLTRRAVVSAVATGYSRFANGDVLLPKVTPTFEAGRVFPVSMETPIGAGTTELHVLRPHDGVDARFISYVCRSRPFLAEGKASQQGVGGLRRVPSDFIAKYPIHIDEPARQRAVADYLDREVQKIDALNAEQNALVGLLRERRSALRVNVALRGVAMTGDLTDSGLPWAREVPSHWEVVPLTSVARLESGHTPSRTREDWWQDCYIPWVSLHDVGTMRGLKVLEDTAQHLSDAGIANSSARVLPARTVVLSRDATVGRTAIMGTPMATSQHFAAWVCGHRLDPEYLWTLFAEAMQPFFDTFQNGSTIRTIGMGDLKAFRIPLPPVDEQRQIVTHLNTETKKIDALIAEANGLVAVAIERRSALITAAVNGHIDVKMEVA